MFHTHSYRSINMLLSQIFLFLIFQTSWFQVLAQPSHSPLLMSLGKFLPRLISLSIHSLSSDIPPKALPIGRISPHCCRPPLNRAAVHQESIFSLCSHTEPSINQIWPFPHLHQVVIRGLLCGHRCLLRASATVVGDKGFCSFHPLALLMPDPGCPTSILQLMAFMPDQPYDLVGLINPP